MHIIKIAINEIILEMTWLKQHNPDINFHDGTLAFPSPRCESHIGRDDQKHKEIRSLVLLKTDRQYAPEEDEFDVLWQ